MTCQHQLGISSQLGIESSDAIDSCSDVEIQFENSCYVDVGLKSKIDVQEISDEKRGPRDRNG